jgi:hypothetical protein
MLDGQCGELGIGRPFPRGPEREQGIEIQTLELRTGMEDAHRFTFEP